MATRKATVQDLEGVAALHVRSMTRLCGGCYTEAQIAAWTGALGPAAYRSALAEKIFLVAHGADGALQGMGLLDAHRCEISALYVDPDHTGRRVGSSLLAALERSAAEAGLAGLTVFATLNAVGFYARHGSVEQGAASHCLPGGVRLACVEMAKRFA